MHRYALILPVLFALNAKMWSSPCQELEDKSVEDLVLLLQSGPDSSTAECFTEAIYKLGNKEPQGNQYADVLVKLLDYRRPPTEAERMHIASTRDWFPATSALFSIGNPALPVLIAHLEGGGLSKTARENAIRTFVSINRDDPPRAISVLKAAARRAESQFEAMNLEAAARDAVERCGKSWKDKCQAVLDEP